MSKYIDAEKLIAEIERKIEEITIECQKSRTIQFSLCGKINGLEQTLNLVRSLQQEMELPEKYQTPDWLFDKQEQQVLPGIEESGIPGKDFIPVEWVDACERYGKWKIVKQEQPEVDLEKLKNKAELIANGIMIGVQANKYHTCIYNKASNDFNHSHLLRAALKGIEVGLNARKEE